MKNLFQENILFRFAVFNSLFARRTFAEFENFVEPHVYVFAVKKRGYVGYVFIEKFVKSGVGSTTDRSARIYRGSPASALRFLVRKFRKVSELFVKEQLFDVIKVFERGNGSKSGTFDIIDYLFHFVERIRFVLVEMRSVFRSYAGFEV